MPHFYTDESVDIYQAPEIAPPEQSQQNGRLIIGDLHANAMYFLYFLVRHGIAVINKLNYKQLVKIYRKGIRLNKKDFNRFNEIVDNHIQIRNQSTVTLIGDILADRGNNDYFILKLLQKLHNGHVNLEIMLSNHDREFIQSYEQHGDFKGRDAQTYPIQSMNNLNTIIRRGWVSRKQIMAMVSQAYKRKLKILSYSLENTGDNATSITIYSHAPIDGTSIRPIAKTLAVTYQADNCVELAKTIDAINDKFQNNYVQTNQISTLCCAKDDPNPQTEPITHIIWNRNTTHLKREQGIDAIKADNIIYVHGHDPKEACQHGKSIVFNLDGYLGKDLHSNRGQYRVLTLTNTYQLTITINGIRQQNQLTLEQHQFIIQLNQLQKKRIQLNVDNHNAGKTA
jgi:hypothetical protein